MKGNIIQALRQGNAYNLLDNSNFAIAQAGYGGKHGDNAYAADRWRLMAGTASALSSAGGVKITGGKWLAKMRQYIPNPTSYVGKTLTFAVKMRSASYTTGYIAIFPLNPDGSYADGYKTSWPTISDDWGIYTVTCTIPSGAANLCVAVDNPNDVAGAYDIEWAALYEGTYNASDLPPYVPKGYAVEQAECKRYYRKIRADMQTFAGYSASGIVYAFIPLNPEMHLASPTVHIGGTVYYTLNGGQGTTTETATLHNANADRVVIKCPVSVTGICTGTITPQGDIDIIADL